LIFEIIISLNFDISNKSFLQIFKFSKNNIITTKPQKALPDTKVLLTHPTMVGTNEWKITVFYTKPKLYIKPRKSHVQEFEWDYC